jgi:hypothetical protein
MTLATLAWSLSSSSLMRRGANCEEGYLGEGYEIPTR